MAACSCTLLHTALLQNTAELLLLRSQMDTSWCAQGVTTGWLAPTLGCLEMMQCITMGVSQDKRRSLGTAGKVRQGIQASCALQLSQREDCVPTALFSCPAASAWRAPASCATHLLYCAALAGRAPASTCNWCAAVLSRVQLLDRGRPQTGLVPSTVSFRCALQARPGIAARCQPLLTACAVQAGADSSATVLQLPHMTGDIMRKLGRKKARTLADMLALSPEELHEALITSGEPLLS